jgi:hypothetical protein
MCVLYIQSFAYILTSIIIMLHGSLISSLSDIFNLHSYVHGINSSECMVLM